MTSVKSAAKGEPVLAGHLALWLTAQAGEYLVGQAHILNASQWSATQSFLVPAVTTLLVAVSAVWQRFKVTPEAKFVERVEAAVADRMPSLVGDAANVLAVAREIFPMPTGEASPTV